MNEEQPEIQKQKPMGLTEMLNHPIVTGFLLPIAKKEMGIGGGDKEVTKKAFGRFMYALRDFIQGTWWVFVLFIFTAGFAIIILLWMRKVLGV